MSTSTRIEPGGMVCNARELVEMLQLAIRAADPDGSNLEGPSVMFRVQLAGGDPRERDSVALVVTP